MTRLQLKHAGIILAAGASSRMGTAKALLRTPDGSTLAEYQARLLSGAGVGPVHLVLGHHGPQIAAQLPPHAFKIVMNPHWSSGRLSSLQAGLRAVNADGYVIMPVDSAGITLETVKNLVTAAGEKRVPAIRPCFNGQRGRLLWIARTMAEKMLLLNASPEFRLDEWILPFEQSLPVDDAGILNNINTPDAWQQVQPTLV